MARHHLDDTPVSANSPYGLMRDDPRMSHLGVGLETCTAIHLPEEEVAPEIYLRPAEQSEIYQCRDRHGVTHPVRTRRHWRLDRDFPKFGLRMQERKRMQSDNVSGCPYGVFALADLLDTVFAALAINPHGTLRQNEARN